MLLGGFFMTAIATTKQFLTTAEVAEIIGVDVGKVAELAG